MYCVITTINEPSTAVKELHRKFGSNLIIVGDTKTPSDWFCNGIKPILDTKLYAPDNHYAKKNLGYLEAMRKGAKLIYDTDDDNIPNGNWKERRCQVDTNISVVSDGWFNIYKTFGIKYLWPRGFPLDRVHKKNYLMPGKRILFSSIQQGVSDGEPDIDAIARLVFKNSPTAFNMDLSVNLQTGCWCPFNSQSTWWFPRAFPLMYLPVNASFRMTDIWRSFVAQKCLWEIGEGVTFHSPAEVFQHRNEHDLMKDFKDEIQGYLHNQEIVKSLDGLKLKRGEDFICQNLLTCYIALVDLGVLPQEIDSVKLWIRDYEEITRNL